MLSNFHRNWEKREKILIPVQEQPEFVITTHIVGKIFSMSMPLSRLQLQTKNIDLVLALQLANYVKMVSQDLMNDSYIRKIFKLVQESWRLEKK